MKKTLALTVFTMFISITVFSQIEITFDNGKTVITEEYRDLGKDCVYKDENGNGVRFKKRDVKMVKNLSLSESEFEYNQLGLTPYVVENIDELSQSEIYIKSINWLKETYKNPNEVIRAEIKNKKLIFQGYSDNAICFSGFGTNCNGVKYRIALAFKDGRYKFEPTSMSYYVPTNKYGTGGDIQIDFYDGMWMYNNKGLLRNKYKLIPSGIGELLNGLNNSLKTYLNKNADAILDEDW